MRKLGILTGFPKTCLRKRSRYPGFGCIDPMTKFKGFDFSKICDIIRSGNGAVAQLGERYLRKVEAVGSNPIGSTRLQNHDLSRDGGTGRRVGLKNRRGVILVWVRFPLSAPYRIPQIRTHPYLLLKRLTKFNPKSFTPLPVVGCRFPEGFHWSEAHFKSGFFERVF